MKRLKLSDRRTQLLGLLRLSPSIGLTVQEVARHFNVSVATARSDLNHLVDTCVATKQETTGPGDNLQYRYNIRQSC